MLLSAAQKIFKIIRGDAATIVRYSRAIFALGWSLAAVAILTNGHGVISAFFIIMFGALASCLTRYEAERGLWMLACAFLAVSLFVNSCLIFGAIRDRIRGANPPDAWIVVDATLGILALQAMIRFLIMVARSNFDYSRHISNR